MVTREEYLDWKRNPVTQALFSSIAERINDGAKDLASSAGLNPSEDRFKVGMIAAFGEVLTVELEDLEGVKENA